MTQITGLESTNNSQRTIGHIAQQTYQEIRDYVHLYFREEQDIDEIVQDSIVRYLESNKQNKDALWEMVDETMDAYQEGTLRNNVLQEGTEQIDPHTPETLLEVKQMAYAVHEALAKNPTAAGTVIQKYLEVDDQEHFPPYRAVHGNKANDVLYEGRRNLRFSPLVREIMGRETLPSAPDYQKLSEQEIDDIETKARFEAHLSGMDFAVRDKDVDEWKSHLGALWQMGFKGDYGEPTCGSFDDQDTVIYLLHGSDPTHEISTLYQPTKSESDFRELLANN